MAMGKAVISTPIGAEGISCTHGKDILLASTATAFADQMIALHGDPAQASALGTAARRLIERSYSDAPIVQELEAFYKLLLKG